MTTFARAFALVALLTFAGGQALLADESGPEDNCGGAYPVAVEAQAVELPDGAPVGSVSYCSDGTLAPVGPSPIEVGPSTCGHGGYPVTVEGDSGDLPEGAPVGALTYCSDATLDELS